MRMVLMMALLMVSSVWANGFSQEGKPVQSEEDNRREAERIWELAIAAKGGRERLHAVTNLQISTRDKYWYTIFKRVPYIEEGLYVFPGKYWQWHDERETIFGFSLRVYNHERDLYLSYLDHGGGGSISRPFDYVRGRSGLITLYDIQLRYLMETKWVKPIPIRVEKTKLGRESVYLVQTIVKGYPTRDGKDEERIGFALDQKTYLPLKVNHYVISSGKVFSGGIRLTDYKEVSGIQMPAKVSGLKTSYQINVEYDDQIFTRGPNVEAGIKQWMKK